jgi:hypothetical protein
VVGQPTGSVMVLLACLAGLVFYLLAGRIGGLGLGRDAGQARAGGAWASGCPARSAPRVASVAPGSLAALGASVGRVMRGRHGRMYEAGIVTSENAWSDNSPQPVSITSSRVPRVPDAYEMRWWASNGDDIVADVFGFAHASQAREFFELASSARCRPASSQAEVSLPQHARDLIWRNPDDVIQADVYMLRGNRVYRVGDVSSQDSRGTPRRSERRRAFVTVDVLACTLPEANCRLLEPLNSHQARSS